MRVLASTRVFVRMCVCVCALCVWAQVTDVCRVRAPPIRRLSTGVQRPARAASDRGCGGRGSSAQRCGRRAARTASGVALTALRGRLTALRQTAHIPRMRSGRGDSRHVVSLCRAAVSLCACGTTGQRYGGTESSHASADGGGQRRTAIQRGTGMSSSTTANVAYCLVSNTTLTRK